jgi:hypothetical protein
MTSSEISRTCDVHGPAIGRDIRARADVQQWQCRPVGIDKGLVSRDISGAKSRSARISQLTVRVGVVATEA